LGNKHKTDGGNPRQINVSLKSFGIKGFLLKANNDIVTISE